jgi:hypothetical protein
MMTFLLAAAAAAATPSPSADPDVHCMAALLVAVGGAKDNPSVSAEEKAGLQSLVMYFYGKLDARRPGADLKSEVMNLLAAPTYQANLRPDLERCSSEAEARGQYLQSFNDAGGAKPAKP